jgi:hypothetical protein
MKCDAMIYAGEIDNFIGRIQSFEESPVRKIVPLLFSHYQDIFKNHTI